MTKQEYYDLLVRSAHDGTFPSAEIAQEDNGRDFIKCLYRGDKTPRSQCRCAIGLLIRDENYGDWVENEPVSFLVLDPVDTISLDELLEIQGCHDDACTQKDSEVVWERDNFLRDINALPCFADVVKVAPDAA